jgi:subtilisin family serine protease
VQPQDPTANNLEMWYEDKSQLFVRVRSPGPAIDPAGWIQVGQSCTPITRTSDGKAIGYIEHLKSETGNGANRVVITLNATDAAAGSGTNAPAPSGTWLVELKHQSGPAAEVHAWIWRDDAGHARNARRRQSRFHPDEADPAYTIAGWATGQLTISVGAYNTATQEVCGYSASGPTRPTGNQPGREKPEVYAPAEEDVRGRGVLSASALSANPTRMNGTSASAPHVTGLIALMFEYARTHAQNAPQSLTANQIRTQLKAGSTVAAVKLQFDRHQKVDARVKTKQKDVQNELLASGKTNFTETMRRLPQ